MKIIRTLLAALFAAGSLTKTDAADKPAKGGAAAMRELRLRWLSETPDRLGIEKTEEFPEVYGVLMDWPVGGGQTATVVSLSTGDASLYTTATFGVIGGIGHESVRKASLAFVKEAQRRVGISAPTTDHSYPDSQHIRFYFLTHKGVRSVTLPISSVEEKDSPAESLFGYGQMVLTELRLTTQK